MQQIQKFLKNVFEVKCQINQQSNPNGPVIQFAVWKIASMQKVLNQNFDEKYATKWKSWLQRRSNGKKIRINVIIQQLVKPFAQKRFKNYCSSLNIDIKAMDFTAFSVNAELIDSIDLLTYCPEASVEEEEDDNDVKSQSDQSYNNISVGESVGETTNNYSGYHHGVSTGHSEYRSHPYRDYGVRRLRHVKCERCGKCKHHCRCYYGQYGVQCSYYYQPYTVASPNLQSFYPQPIWQLTCSGQYVLLPAQYAAGN